jgi:hypothetical protein
MAAAIIRCICAGAITICASQAIGAAAPPEVADHIDKAKQYCLSHHGKVRFDRGFPKVADINGDGGEDWILDFSKFHCDGSVPTEPYCGSGGCSLLIFLWNGGASWKLSFHGVVHSYRLLHAGRAAKLEVFVGGSLCGKTGAHACRELYDFRGSDLVPSDTRKRR